MPGVAGWIQVRRGTEGAGWCGRRKHQVVSHRGALLLLGGYAVHGEGAVSVNLHDVWRSEDGQDWEQLVVRAPWNGRDGHAAVVHNGNVYLMGGTQDPLNNYNDVWRSSDGKEWSVVCRQAAWQGRWQHAAVSHGGYLYVLGGWAGEAGYLNDVWRSADGIRWTRCCLSAPWRRRMFHTVLSVRGAMYLMGGSDGRNKLNDVWASQDGKEWTPVAQSAQWCPRAGHAAVVFDGCMYIFGGENASRGKLDDVWVSEDGAHWEPQLEPRSFGCRQGHAAVTHGASIFVMGGVDGSGDYLADCHRSMDEAEMEAAEQAAQEAPPEVEEAIAATNGDPAQRYDAQAGSISPSEEGGSVHRISLSPAPRGRLNGGLAGRAVSAAAGHVFGASGGASSRASSRGRNGADGSERGGSGRARGSSGITVSTVALVQRLSQLQREWTALSQERRANLALLALVESGLNGLLHPAAAAAFEGEMSAAAAAAASGTRAEFGAPASSAAPDNIPAFQAARPISYESLNGAEGLEALRVAVEASRAEIEGYQRSLRIMARRGANVPNSADADNAAHHALPPPEVADLVGKRAAAAAAALPNAAALYRIQTRLAAGHDLREASVSAAMAGLEQEARKRGGTVWLEMRSSRVAQGDDGEQPNGNGAPTVPAAGAAAAGAAAPSIAAGATFRQSSNGAAAAGAPGSAAAALPIDDWSAGGSALPRFLALAQQVKAEGGGGTVPHDSEAAAAVAALRDKLASHAASCNRLQEWITSSWHAVPSDGGTALPAAAASPVPAAAAPAEAAGDPAAAAAEAAGESGASTSSEEDPMEHAYDVDAGEAELAQVRMVAHRAVDVELLEVPAAIAEARRLGDRLVLCGHDRLTQALTDLRRGTGELSLGAADLGRWTVRLEGLSDAESLASRCDAAIARLAALQEAQLDADDRVVDSRGALEKRRRRGGRPSELAELAAEAAEAESAARRVRRERRRAISDLAAFTWEMAPELALRCPEVLHPLHPLAGEHGSGGASSAAGVSLRSVSLPLRLLNEYEEVQPLHNSGDGGPLGAAGVGGGVGPLGREGSQRHRMLKALFDDEFVVLKGYALVSDRQRRNFERELRILSRVRHDAVIRATAVVEDPNSSSPVPMLYIEFPFCAGGSLRDWLRAANRAPWELQGAFRQVLCGAAHLHDRGIVHKDIKPGNILVHADGRVLLADFDISSDFGGSGAGGEGIGGHLAELDNSTSSGRIERLNSDLAHSNDAGDAALLVPMSLRRTASTTTVRAGTAGFMAPEVESGRAATPASDMYSLGAVLFWMHFPDHPTGPVAGVPDDAAAADPALAALLRRLLAADPAERPSASDALMDPYFRASGVERLLEDGALVQQDAKLEALRSLFQAVRREAIAAAAATGGSGGRTDGAVRWTVQRSPRALVPGVLAAVDALDGVAMRRPLRVIFEGEAGVDEGGMLSEMFTLFFEAVLAPRFGLFETCSSAPTAAALAAAEAAAAEAATPRARAASHASADAGMWEDAIGAGIVGLHDHAAEREESAAAAPDDDDEKEVESMLEQQALADRVAAAPGGRTYLPTARQAYSEEQLKEYKAVGLAIAKCLYEGRRLGSRLAPSLFKFVAGAEPTLADLRDFDEQAAAGLQWLLANPGVRGMGFHFEDVGYPDKGPVTDATKSEFVRLKVHQILVTSRRKALEALRDGFASGLARISPAATPFLRLLSHADWRVLLSGQLHVSGAQVVAVLRWYNFSSRSQVPTWLKALLMSMPEDTLRRFLVFACGTPSLPAAAVGRVEITVRCQPRSAALPVAHTCFFQLDVPDYDREAVLRHKLLQAMNNTASFDVV